MAPFPPVRNADEFRKRFQSQIENEPLPSRPRFERPEKKSTGRYDPNARAKSWLAAHGYKFERVDWFDARFNRAHDLLGMFDYLAFADGVTVGVQITTISNMSSRRNKILGESRLKWVLEAHWKVLLLGIEKNKDVREEWIAL